LDSKIAKGEMGERGATGEERGLRSNCEGYETELTVVKRVFIP
jgi:hypothetical protein